MTDSAAATALLEQVVEEMESRYGTAGRAGSSGIWPRRHLKGEGTKWIVVAMDELADLVMQDKANEDLLVRLAQKGRAAGIPA